MNLKDLKDLKKLFQKQGDEEKNSYLSDKKNRANLFIAFLVGILILISISFFKTSNTQISAQDKNNTKAAKEQQKTEEQNTDQEQYESEVQDKLKDTLEKIEGVGKVDVMVSFESGEEQVPAVNVSDSTNTTEEKDNEGGVRNSTQKNNGSTVVITNDGSKSKPLIVKTYKPKVSGVCVVAEGSENKLTELRITKAVVNLFNISEDKVNVYPMKK